MKNVVVLLYIGLVMYEMCYVMVCCVVENLVGVLVGMLCMNFVNLDVLVYV